MNKLAVILILVAIVYVNCEKLRKCKKIIDITLSVQEAK
jgi:hypothetical protein